MGSSRLSLAWRRATINEGPLEAKPAPPRASGLLVTSRAGVTNGVLGFLRLRLGLFLSGVLGRVFARAWPRKLLAHGLSPDVKRRLALEISPEAIPDPAVARAYLARLSPEAALDTVCTVLEHHVPHSFRPQLTARLLRRAESEPAELTSLEAIARALVVRNERTLPYAYDLFGTMVGWFEAHAGGLAGKRVLELGPGHSLAIPALLVTAGVKTYTGVDLFPIARTDPAIYRQLRADLAAPVGLLPTISPEARAALATARVASLERLDAVVQADGERAVFDASRLILRCPVDASRLPFEEASFDVCLSKSSFEHFRDPDAAARESVRVLAPGGVGFHDIDLGDHRDRSKPRDFLRWDAPTWESCFDAAVGPLPPGLEKRDPFEFTNRRRVSDYVAAFRATGAEVTVQVLARAPLGTPELDSLHPSFRARSSEDLEVIRALFVVRRPPATGAS